MVLVPHRASHHCVLSYTPELKVLSYFEWCGGLVVFKQIFRQISCFGGSQLLSTEWIYSSDSFNVTIGIPVTREWGDVTGNDVWAEPWPWKLLGGVCAMGALGAHLLISWEPASSPGGSLQKDGWLCPQNKLKCNWPMISHRRSVFAERRGKIHSLFRFLEIWTELLQSQV